MTAIHGVSIAPENINADRVASLRDDHIVRFKAPPKTVMINPMGPDDHWLVVDSTYPAQMEKRIEILQEKRDWVLDRLPGDDVRAAEYELRDVVTSFLTQTYPDYFIRQGDELSCNLTGLTVNVGPYGADPLVATMLLASEDMLLMVPTGKDAKGTTIYPLKSGVLAFPNGWALRSQFNEAEPPFPHVQLRTAWREAQAESLEAARLGKTTYQIHNGHVRHFMENYATRVDLFFTNMPAGQGYWRRNWSPSLSSTLFRHSDSEFPPAPDFTPALWAERGHVRSEHETFLKLPFTKAVVFGIKTYIWPLQDIAANAEGLSALKTAYDAMEKTPSMFEYRNESLPTFGEHLRSLPNPNGP